MLILQSLSIETVVSYYGYKNVDDNDNVDVNQNENEVLMNVYSLWVRF